MTYSDIVEKLRFRLKDAAHTRYSDMELLEDVRASLETLGWRMTEVGLEAPWLEDDDFAAPGMDDTVTLDESLVSVVVALAQAIEGGDPRMVQAIADVALRACVTVLGEAIEPDSDELPW